MLTDTSFIPTTAMYLRLPAEWDGIEHVRQFLTTYVASRGTRDHADRVSIVVHELLENAVKFGSMNREIELDVRLAKVGGEFEVRVSNGVVGSRLELLSREIERFQALSPADGYLDAIKRGSNRITGSGGIGLARIRAEARVNLHLEVHGDWVTLIALSTND